MENKEVIEKEPTQSISYSKKEVDELINKKINDVFGENRKSITKEDVDNWINKKISDTFGDLLKGLNQKEPKKEEPKEKTIEDLYF